MGSCFGFVKFGNRRMAMRDVEAINMAAVWRKEASSEGGYLFSFFFFL